MTNPSPSNSIWNRALNYENGDLDQREPLAQAVKTTLIDAGVQVDVNALFYVSKLTPQGLHNQMWQGRGNTTDHIVHVYLDKSGNDEAIKETAVLRLNPTTANGFETIIVCEESGADISVRAVIEFESSEATKKFEDLIGTAIQVQIVSDPSKFAGVNRDPDGNAQLRTPVESVSDDQSGLTVQVLIEHLNEARNVVLSGPPGVGKTRLAFELIDALAGDPSNDSRVSEIEQCPEDERADRITNSPLVWEFVQLHSNYTYDDFVQGVRAASDGSGYRFDQVPGILLRICHIASQRPDKPVLLVLDEMNRTDFAAVAGEALFALDPDHRGTPVSLQRLVQDSEYLDLVVPPNLLVLATINSADRSISMLDMALRRRFRFLPIEPSVEAIEEYYADYPERLLMATEIFRQLSERISDSELRPGHSYMLVADQDEMQDDEFAEAITRKIVYELRPLLMEYEAAGLISGSITIVGMQDQSADLRTTNGSDVLSVVKSLQGVESSKHE